MRIVAPLGSHCACVAHALCGSQVIAETHEAWRRSHGAIQKKLIGRSGTGFGIMSSPSMSELEAQKAAENGSGHGARGARVSGVAAA